MLNIDISTENKKKNILELFKSFKKVSDIYKYYGVSDNSTNCKYVNYICKEIGFDKTYYKNSKKEKFCIVCGKKLIGKQNKFCSHKCSAIYNNKCRTMKQNVGEKISEGLKKYHETLDGLKVHGKEKRKLRYKTYTYDINNKKVLKKCWICGSDCLSCKHENIHRHDIRFFRDNLVYFGFNIDLLGKKNAIDEYERIVDLLKYEYYENLLSINQIKEKYAYPHSVERLVGMFKSIGMELRNNSLCIKNAYKQGRLNPPINSNSLKFKTGWHIGWKGNKFYYRSSYELEYALELDENKINYEVEGLRFEYFDTNKNKNRIAIPDFHLIDEKKIVEVKSLFTFNKQNMIDRFNVYIQNGYIPCLLYEKKMYNYDEMLKIEDNDYTINDIQ